MFRLLSCVVVLLLSFTVNAQNITIQGKVLEGDTQLPIEAATVYLSAVADSTLIDYTITDRNGAFKLTTKKIDKPAFLKISYVGFKTFIERQESITENKDFGALSLLPADNMLGEVVVISEAPPIRIKSDTLEFNASSFKVRPDANVETLLKQLPGLEIDADGKITVNGKEVNQILVNGKPFFDKDGKIALQNLPSEIINKVQITDTKTKKEELAGQAASSNNASINLTIDEDKNKGLFGKFLAGYGTDERYESSALVNYFKNDTKFSLLAASNNINSTGFTMNEVFDSMGGGRNSSLNSYGNGAYSVNGMRFGTGNGITTSNMLGLNYADKFFDAVDVRTSYFITDTKTDNESRSRVVNLLPDGNITTESAAVNTSDRTLHNFSLDIEYKIDSTASVFVSPKFTKTNSKYKNQSSESSIDDDGRLLNDNTEQVLDDADNHSFSNSMVFTKTFRRKNRVLTLSLDNDNNKDDIRNLTKSSTTFYDDANEDGIADGTRRVVRDQISTNKNKLDNYSVGFEFQEPITDSLHFVAGFDYADNRFELNRESLDFDASTNSYSVRNDSLSRQLTTFSNTFSPTIGIAIRKSKVDLKLELGTTVSEFQNKSYYLGNDIRLDRQYLMPSAQATANIKFTKAMSLWASYNYNVEYPEANQILPVEDFYNPLNTIIGNVNLDPSEYHNVFINFRNYDFSKKTGFNIYLGGNFYDKQIIASTDFNSSGKRTTTYENVSGAVNSWVGINWNKTIKKEAHTFKYSLGMNVNVGQNLGFTNGALYEATSLRYTPRVSFSYDYGELLSISPSYNFSTGGTKYTNFLVDRASNITHRFNLQTTTYWPKNVVFGNDFGYTYNSNIADGFKKDFYLWNMSLGYNFLGDRLLAKVKVYDLLNQNQSATRTISATTIRDEENIVLQRYAMFSLTYKIEKFGGVKKERQGMR